MSHFCVAVFADSDTEFDNLLAPYNEADEDYFELFPLSDDLLDIIKHSSIVNKCSIAEAAKDYGCKVDDNGNILGYRKNPRGYWDYYTLDARMYEFTFRPNVSEEDKLNPRKNMFLYNDNMYPYAFITPDGEWHSPGRVGWFGVSTENEESLEKYIKEWKKWIMLDDNPYVSFVDCHI